MAISSAKSGNWFGIGEHSNSTYNLNVNFHQLALANRSIIDKVLNKEFYGFRVYFTHENLC